MNAYFDFNTKPDYGCNESQYIFLLMILVRYQ